MGVERERGAWLMNEFAKRGRMSLLRGALSVCREGEKTMANEGMSLLRGALCGCRDGEINVADE